MDFGTAAAFAIVICGSATIVGRSIDRLGEILKEQNTEQQRQIDELRRELEEMKQK